MADVPDMSPQQKGWRAPALHFALDRERGIW
jgi:hypothetical protein